MEEKQKEKINSRFEKEQKEFQEEIDRIIQLLKKRYQPVSAKLKPNSSLTTSEFFNKFSEHYPKAENMSESDLYELLKKEGYTYDLVGDRIEWLIHI